MSQRSLEHEEAEQPQLEMESEPHQQSAEPGALALSAVDFSALEERVLRAVELVKRERQARAAAEERAVNVEAQLHEQTSLADQLHKDVHALKAERDHVRQRVERLLSQLDALEL